MPPRGGSLLTSEPDRYARALEFLFQRTTGAIRPGLERIGALLSALGAPQERLGTVVHIAGTNGKGSTAATVEALLRASGARTALYTSPHLVDFTERIVVDGVPVARDIVTDLVWRAMPAIERTGATFFEATTALALLYFAEARVEAAVIETGLGGRLDATNVVQPAVAAVTSIGIDHAEYLGDSIPSIAAEKAGIFKRGAGAAIGDGDPTVVAMLREHAVEHGATPVRAVLDEGWPSRVEVGGYGTSFLLRGAEGEGRRWSTPLIGHHQAANTALALLAHEMLGPSFALDPARAQEALDTVRVRGRFQRAGRYLLDVAHNPAGSAVLAATVVRLDLPRPLVTLLAVLSDKDWRGMMEVLAPCTDLFVLTTAPSAPENRRWDPAEAHRVATAAGWRSVVESQFDAALALADREGATVLVTGSFHTVGDLLSRLPAASRDG